MSGEVLDLQAARAAACAPATPYEERLRAAAEAVRPDPLPCPFCGGTDLGVGEIGTLEGPDIVAYECMTDGCYGMAAAAVWNRRAGGAA